MTHETSGRPRTAGHPGLDNDEAMDEGKIMTAEGTKGRAPDTVSAPRPEDHPGLDNDEATDEGKMMTAEGSTDPQSEQDEPE
jgi:hypothetical protein